VLGGARVVEAWRTRHDVRTRGDDAFPQAGDSASRTEAAVAA
jgi:hypothetical protein